MKNLRENKDSIIRKLPRLTKEEKDNVIEFFHKYPAYESPEKSGIDWSRPDVLRNLRMSDFTKLMAQQAFKPNKKQKKNSPDLPHIYSNDMWDFYMPLTWEGGKLADSAKIGGQKAGWCIGWVESSCYFDGYRNVGDTFVMAVRKELPDGFEDSLAKIEQTKKPNMSEEELAKFENTKNEHAIVPFQDKFEAVKYMIQISAEYDHGYGSLPIPIGENRGIRVWCQSDHNCLRNNSLFETNEAVEKFRHNIFMSDSENMEDLLLKWDTEYNDIAESAKTIWNMLVLPPVSFLDDEELDYADDDYLEMLIDQYDKFSKLPDILSTATNVPRRCITIFENNPLILGITFQTSKSKMEAINFKEEIYKFLGFTQTDSDSVLKRFGLGSLMTLTGRSWETSSKDPIPEKYNHIHAVAGNSPAEVLTKLFSQERDRLDDLFED